MSQHPSLNGYFFFALFNYPVQVWFHGLGGAFEGQNASKPWESIADGLLRNRSLLIAFSR
jgi:hypothetical protein